MGLLKSYISRGETQLQSEIDFRLDGTSLEAHGQYTSADGQGIFIDQVFELPEGTSRIEIGIADSKMQVRLVQPSPVFDPSWQVVQVLTGLGSGILVEDGAIKSDIIVLAVTE